MGRWIKQGEEALLLWRKKYQNTVHNSPLDIGLLNAILANAKVWGSRHVVTKYISPNYGIDKNKF